MDINNDSDTESRNSSQGSSDSGAAAIADNQVLTFDNSSHQSNDSTTDDENEKFTSEQAPQDFDLSLPVSHSYLGTNLEELRGRTILDEGIYLNLPLLIKDSMILFPGQTLPLAVFNINIITMLEKCIQDNRTFGVLCYHENKIENIGTTAEIYEFSHGSSPGEGLRIKAKGRQRFKILQFKEGANRTLADVKIMPEITLSHPLFGGLRSMDHLSLRSINGKEQKQQDHLEVFESMNTSWPAFVYRQYDSHRLSYAIKQQLQFIEIRGSFIPMNPTDLSFWVAQNLPLSDAERIKLLTYDCAVSRLQWELDYLTKDRVLVCHNCENVIGKHADIFPMSQDGPQNTFCNAGGYTHDTVTLYHAKNLKKHDDRPSPDYSWFPGYAWTIVECKFCSIHMGWLFTVIKDKKLKPTSFWGLVRRNLESKKLGDDFDTECENTTL
ncbi:protein cereblon [Copidosoma floridanum]|uniref:protein cereblon n=1 Tax=Copidosoma floridanum TaxID=29053 RepID=UPI000C6FA677|nr:protein cereblon [Copidosoma floridanum]